MSLRVSAITAIILFLFGSIGTGLVAFTYEGTRERIAANERETLLRKLHVLVAPERHDNDLFADTLQITDPALRGTQATITAYRARRDGRPVALILAPVAPDGYSGSIRLLVGINDDATLAGVRVVSHRETPGLGDGIEESRSDWIHGFDGKSLENPPLEQWQVRKDGGYFDQLTGATITSRAVVRAVRDSLLYYGTHRDELFADHGQGPATQPRSGT